jgi:CO dehydrogenase/acetyl-CoA synthase beta subunit
LNKTIDKGISDIVGCLTDPIIVFPGGWGDSIPEWLKNAITLERLMDDMKSLKGEEATGTDAEACAYLMTASLTQPIDSDWTNIYLYIAGKTYARWNKNEIPEDIRITSLNDEQMRDLNRLKDWLYRQRIKTRLEKDRAERREKREEREEAEVKRQAEQPVLFKF